jgi:hypothetical protein
MIELCLFAERAFRDAFSRRPTVQVVDFGGMLFMSVITDYSCVNIYCKCDILKGKLVVRLQPMIRLFRLCVNKQITWKLLKTNKWPADIAISEWFFMKQLNLFCIKLLKLQFIAFILTLFTLTVFRLWSHLNGEIKLNKNV